MASQPIVAAEFGVPSPSFQARPSGFLHTPLERHYRAQVQRPKKGTHLHLPGLGNEAVQVTDDDQPAAVCSKLDSSEADRYELMVWKIGSP